LIVELFVCGHDLNDKRFDAADIVEGDLIVYCQIDSSNELAIMLE